MASRKKKKAPKKCDWCGRSLAGLDVHRRGKKLYCSLQCVKEVETKQALLDLAIRRAEAEETTVAPAAAPVPAPPPPPMPPPPPAPAAGGPPPSAPGAAPGPRSWEHPAVLVLLGLLAALVVALAIVAGEYARQKRYVKMLKGKVVDYMAVERQAAAENGRLRIDYPAGGAVIPTRKIPVSGAAPANAVLLLFVNGEYRQTVRATGEGRFIFPDAALSAGADSLRVEGVAGGKRYSQAVAVECRPPAPAPGPAGVTYASADSNNFTRGDVRRPWVALTFDGGADSRECARILDTLKSRQVRATIFLTGEFLGRYAALVRRMAAEGHEIANHTDGHPHLTMWEEEHTHRTRPEITPAFVCDQLDRLKQKLARLGVPMVPLWRAPYGETNPLINAWARSCGYRHAGWTQGTTWSTNLDTNDWVPDSTHAGYFTSDQIVEKILNFGKNGPYGLNGGIVLMHLGTQRPERAWMVNKLGYLIDQLKGRGYKLVKISEMM